MTKKVLGLIQIRALKFPLSYLLLEYSEKVHAASTMHSTAGQSGDLRKATGASQTPGSSCTPCQQLL